MGMGDFAEHGEGGIIRPARADGGSFRAIEASVAHHETLN
jgi:hypothetical protein